MSTKKTMRVLSIDAWADGDGGYTWNQWFDMGSIPRDTPTDQMVEAAYNEGIFSKPRLPKGYTLHDDQYNIVVQDKDGCPLYAFEYGDNT